MRLAHGEGLARERAALIHGGEERALVHGRHQHAAAVVLGGQPAQGLLAVHEVHGNARVELYPFVQEALQRAHVYRVARAGYGHGHVAGAVYKAEHMALARAALHVHAAALAPGGKVVHHFAHVRAEQHAVHGLEHQRLAVQVDQLAQRVARRMVRALLGREPVAQVEPALARGGQRVVAVAHGYEHVARAAAQLGHGAKHEVGGLALHGPAAYVAAALHQLKVVYLAQALAHLVERLYHRAPGVVQQHHYVRQLYGRVAAYLYARGYALQYGALGGAHRGARARRKVVGLQVDRGHQPHAVAVQALALHQYEAVHTRRDNALAQVALHLGVYGLRALVALGEERLGVYQPERGGCVAHLALHLMPVFGLGGVLIAGHHRPFAHINSVCGQVYVVHCETDVFVLFH